MRQGALAIIVAVAVTAALAGCGGGDSDSSASLSKPQFVKQANALCKQEWQEGREEALGKIGNEFSPNANFAEKEKALAILLRPYETTTTKLSELGAPAGDEQEMEAIVSAMEKAAVDVKKNPSTAFESDLPFRKANQLVEDYGLKQCQA